MMKRQRDIEDGKSTLAPIMIFPEGTTSNCTVIQKFRRGAFEAERSVVPMTVSYGTPVVHPSNEAIPDFVGMCLILCQFRTFTGTITVYPMFTPTDYLFAKHSG